MAEDEHDRKDEKITRGSRRARAIERHCRSSAEEEKGADLQLRRRGRNDTIRVIMDQEEENEEESFMPKRDKQQQ